MRPLFTSAYCLAMTCTHIVTLTFLTVLGALAISPFVPKLAGAQVYQNSYPWGYQPTLTCSPSSQTVALGQNVVMYAVGTPGTPFRWNVDDHTYQSSDPVLSHTFFTSGTRLITVSNDTLSSTCQVTVLASGVPVANTSQYSAPYVAPNYSNYPTTPYTYSSNYYAAPSLPNTGYGPLSSVQVAILISLLSAMLLAVLPYVRKAIVAIG
jgi:hypothetical protein